jgi:UDP-N-acetylmuramoyl-tripeptide--D-alanyl-D-alanine ligase
VIRVGRTEKVDYRLSSVETDGTSSRFSLEGPKGRAEVRLPVPGPHMAMNAAMALAAGIELGIDPKAASEALQKVQLPSGRVRLEKHKAGWLLDDSYNANPDSLAAAVATLESLPGRGRAVALLGAMAELGSFSRMLHEESGSMIARSRAGLCFAVGADSKFLVETAQKARQGDWARWFASREELLAAYRREAKSDDRILVKGSRSQQMDLVAAELRKGS